MKQNTNLYDRENRFFESFYFEIQEQLIKRNNEQGQNDEETFDEEMNESSGERIEEAKNILDKIEELRRDPKYGNRKNVFYFPIENNLSFQHVWMMKH